MGKLLIFSAPSGSGKTTIVKELLKRVSNLEFSVSACSRQPRGNEKNGVDYYFLTVEDFKEKIKNDDFVEFEEVYPNQYYGTLKSELDRIWNNGNHVVFDVDVVGGLNLKQKFSDKAMAVFIQPPSIEELRKRLINRGTDSVEQINKRIKKAEYEIGFANKFDLVVLNDDLQKAISQTVEKVVDFINK
ncbi:MAG: guanylate kinase [Bacteroidales bacterium]